LFALVEENLGDQPDLSVVAVGGYGRGELSPHSDIDLLFLLPPKSEVTKATLRGLLYPLWDAGWQVGHAARTPKEVIDRTEADLDSATAVLSARPIAGDEALFQEFLDRRERWLRKSGRTIARRIIDATAERHRRVDRAGWVLAPDLREDIGGLRDLHRIAWLRKIAGDETPLPVELAGGGELLLAVREALHGQQKRKGDALRIDLQPKVAAAMDVDADSLMFEVHSVARTIEHRGELISSRLAARVLGGPKRSGWVKRLGHRIRLEEGALALDAGLDPGPVDVLRLLSAHASEGRPIEPATLERVANALPHDVAPWDQEMRDAFFAILAGEHCISALELLDHIRAWPVLVPEWDRIRALAQHDPYHRYTVDGHLFVVVRELRRAIEIDVLARAAVEEAGDLDTLRLATLLHDVGKGSGHDHSVVGEELARTAAQRMGLSTEEVEEVAALVRWHLLLVDTATRRDLDDGSVIAEVADRMTGRRLRLLYILTVADGLGTGPEGWNDWKATLVAELYRKTLIALETGEIPTRSDVTARAREVEAYEPSLAGRAQDVLATLPHSYLEATSVPDMVDDIRLLLQPPDKGEVRHRVYEGTERDQAAVTVCVADRPGTLARTAGVLALNRISVLRAQAFSTSAGLALERFVVRVPEAASWESVAADLEAAYSGRLALEARLERKIQDYRPPEPVEPDIRILQDASAHSTVIEVRAPDTLGLLFALTAALSDLDLDIHVAKIDTLGHRVVDVFYVRSAWGEKLTEAQADEVRRSIAHRIGRLFG